MKKEKKEPREQSARERLAALRKGQRKAEVVVIVGGGPAGLLTAYLLLKRHGGRYIPVVLDGATCHARVGGNAYTVPVEVNGISRWVDLGVNDYNAATYRNIHKLLQELGVEGKRLRDTTTWAGTSRGQPVSYTDDDLAAGRVPCELARDFYRFKAEAYNDAMYNNHFTSTLAEYAASKGYSELFLSRNLYPRVNGMYYVDQTLPAPQMPLGAVMRYYGLQEGFGTGPADRRYFVDGSTHWLETLADAIVTMGGVVAARSTVGALRASGKRRNPIRVEYRPAACPWWRPAPAAPPEQIDCSRVVLATHADAAATLLQGHAEADAVRELLQRIRYTRHEELSAGGRPVLTRAIAHTDASVLPDPQRRSTYNITVHDDYDNPHPYTISYWCNSHQNDAADERYRACAPHDFYVTINPPADRQPAEDKILKTPAPDGSGRLIDAIAHFAHNTEGVDTWEVQKLICSQHQGEPLLGGRVYFAGGWGIGAGLHEECWHAADVTVRRISGKDGRKAGQRRCAELIGPSRTTTDRQGTLVQVPPAHLQVTFGRIGKKGRGS